MSFLAKCILLVFLLNIKSVLAQSGNNEPHDLEEEEKEVLPYEVPFCGDIDPESVCSIECYQDPDCQTFGYNLTAFPCKCAAQICPDKLLYGSIGNQKSPPLTDEQIKLQPHVSATCFPKGWVPAEIAPYHKQIGTCT